MWTSKGWYCISSASQICTFIFNSYIQNDLALGLFGKKRWVHFFSHLFHFPLFQIPLQRWISIFSTCYQSDKNVNLQEINLYLCYCCLLTTVCPAVSLRRKTCVLRWSDSVFLMAYCRVDQETELCFLCSFTSCLFLYWTGFILLMHFDDEESLPQATLKLSVHVHPSSRTL